MIDTCIADNIKHIICTKGLKKCAVAKKAGFSDQQFSALLNKRRVIRDIDIISIANALDVSPNEMFGINISPLQ